MIKENVRARRGAAGATLEVPSSRAYTGRSLLSARVRAAKFINIPIPF
jgi:hypothetical protein